MLTQRLAEFIVDTPIDAIPLAVLDGARNALIDTIGCALAGLNEPGVEIATQCVQEMEAKPVSAVWGRSFSTVPAEAAFVNGNAAHALDFDDSLPTLRGHPGVTLAPAVMAAGESAGASGKEVLAAFALGLEVAGKLGRAVGPGHYLRGWHTTSTVGVFAAATAAARLWKLDAMQLRNAWGLAASQVAGLIRNFGTMTKPFHAGNAARSGVSAAWMASRGFTADISIFDGDDGFLATYAGNKAEPLSAVLQELGKPWDMLEPSIYVKRWPCCYCNHRPLGGILKLIEEHDLHGDEIDSVKVGFQQGAANALISTNPQTGLEAKFSIEYVAAAALLDRAITLKSFTDAMVQRPPIRKLIAKVRRYAIAEPGDDTIYSSTTGYCDVEIATQRGVFNIRIDTAPGSPEWPMTYQDRVEKFIDCARQELGMAGATALLKLLQDMGNAADLKAIAQATRRQPAKSVHRAAG